jgi:hypothetical protein
MALITLRCAILLHKLSGIVTRVHIHAATTKGLACPLILGALSAGLCRAEEHA